MSRLLSRRGLLGRQGFPGGSGFLGKWCGRVGRLRLHMARTEHGSRIKNPVAALLIGGREVQATMVANWFSGSGLHFLSLRGGGGTLPRVFLVKECGSC